jgi:hypothetical protein
LRGAESVAAIRRTGSEDQDRGLAVTNRTSIKRPKTIGGKKQRMHIPKKSMLAAALLGVAMSGSPYEQMRLPAGALLSARRD